MEKLIQSKFIKILAVMVILIMPMMFGNTVHAADHGETKSIADVLEAGKTWISQGKEKADEMGYGSTPEDFVESFIGVGQVLIAIGIVTIVIVTIIMAIKWLTATPDKQAKLKVQLIGLVLSIVVIFGAVGIWSLVKGIMKKVEEDPNMLGQASSDETIIIANK